MNTDQPLFLNEEQVREHLRMTDLIPAMEKALIDFSAGRVTQPVRSVLSVNPPGGFLGLMPAFTPDGLGLKAVTFYPSNAQRGIPTHMFCEVAAYAKSRGQTVDQLLDEIYSQFGYYAEKTQPRNHSSVVHAAARIKASRRLVVDLVHGDCAGGAVLRA